MVVDSDSDNTLRISKTHNVPFYVRAGTNFLQGVTGKDGVEKKIFDTIVVSALGAAIPTAASVTGLLEKNNVGTVEKIQTGYTELDFGRRPHIMVTVKRNPAYVAPVKGGKEPACPDRLNEPKLEKKMKKVLKEGGKRGVEIEGAADMGGLKYFCTKVDEPAGDLDMLVESVKAMNAKCDPSEEERKGGSGAVGKVVMSHNKVDGGSSEKNKLCVCAYVPGKESCSAKDWLQGVLSLLGIKLEVREDSNQQYAQILIEDDAEKNIFVLKHRDYVIQHSNGWLRSKGLVPDLDDEDEDDMVFGDEDFPS